MSTTTTMTLQSKVGVFAGAALLRFILFAAFPSLPDLLTGRVEISTPVTSFKRCKAHREPHRRDTAIELDALTIFRFSLLAT